MNVVLDACTLINLMNGKVLQTITRIPGCSFFVGENLREQEILNSAQILMLEALVSTGDIRLLESSITLQEFIALKKKYDLGDGETESIALCKHFGYIFGCDDRKARRSANKELGSGYVIGSLFLLREAHRHELLTLEEVLNAVDLMKQKGGFLPSVPEAYFLE